VKEGIKAKASAKHRPSFYQKIAIYCSQLIGSEWAFLCSCLFIITWLICGPIFHFSDTWQLVVNTTTTIITFLIVFLIQNSQNREAKAVQLKLDELLRCHKLAHNSIIDLDELSDEEMKELEKHYKELSGKKSADTDEK
jgi:low affinity Fe/Cu permease